MILITGANGFVGRRLCERLVHDGHDVRAALRSAGAEPTAGENRVVGDIDGHTDWTALLAGVDRVVHLAARVHMMDDRAPDPLAEFRRVNVAGTLNLAHQAAAAGVRRFVFVSSIKVNGEATRPGQAFTADDPAAPEDLYGISKHEAEQGLRALAAECGLEVVIVRPPLVYGPGVKANFARLMGWLARGLPLPLGAITGNRRSMVALDNLVDLLAVCLDHPAAARQTFLAADGQDLSTAGLARRLGAALGKPARLLPVPTWLLGAGAALIGRRGLYQRLCGSLQVDIAKTRRLLGWQPPVTVDEGLRRVARGNLR